MGRLSKPAAAGLLVAVACVLAAAPAAPANLLVNADFETGPAIPTDAVQLAAGSTAITGWVVTHVNLDYSGSRMTAAYGTRSIGLNGSDVGGIAQTFASQSHAEYTVHFWMTADPFSTPAIKWLRVTAAGQSADFSADNTGMWPWDPGWNDHAWTFTANSSSTTLEFYSLMSGDTGPVIDSVTVALTSTADVGDEAFTSFALSAVSPNPVRNAARMSYTVPRPAAVHLSVFDLSGREVAVLADGFQSPGRYTATWNARIGGGPAAPGVYLVALRAAGQRSVQRIVLVH
jgi:choice-of-anchor C domain-containing protein